MSAIERRLIRLTEHLLRARNRKPLTPDDSVLRLGRTAAIFDSHWSGEATVSTQDRLRHRITVGATGIGKSVSALDEHRQNRSLGVGSTTIDTHNTIEKQLRMIAREVLTGRVPISALDDILLFSPDCKHWTTTIAPLQCSSPDRAIEPVNRMMQWIKATWGDTIGAQTYQFGQSLFTLLAERQVPISATLSLLGDPVQLRSHAVKLINRRAQEYFLRQYLTWSPRRQAQVAEALINKIVILLADPRVEAALSSETSDIDFRRAMDEGKTILIHISRSEFFDSVNWLAGLVLVSIQQAIFSRANVQEEHRRPHILTIEEFTSFATAATVEPLLNEARKFGLGLHLITQTFATLEKSLLSSVRANCLTQVFFRLSPEDAQAAANRFTGELRNALYQKLVSLPIGIAVLLQGGKAPRLLKVDNVHVPEKLSSEEEDIIERIRRNVGRPFVPNRPSAYRPETIHHATQPPVSEIHHYDRALTQSESEFIEGDA